MKACLLRKDDDEDDSLFAYCNSVTSSLQNCKMIFGMSRFFDEEVLASHK